MNKHPKTTASRRSIQKWLTQTSVNTLLLSTALATSLWSAQSQAVAVTAPVVGEIEKIILNEPQNHWSGGIIVAGGQNIIIPKNLLIDLPANRVTLQQLFIEASASCITQSETGLAKGDACNASGTGAIATIMATRNDNGHVIAGDVLIQKGVESVTGQITYINYREGYFRINGQVGSATKGTMVRLNDPDGRHTQQSGLGCKAGSPNCSADPRFTLDGDNYTNVFSNGYPSCIPSSSVSRNVPSTLGLVGVTTTIALNDGTGDVLCPTTNRPSAGLAVADSRRFAPILIGDSITAEGNYEEVGGVSFLSAHSTTVSAALATNPNNPNQPDYLFLDEVGIDAPGFQNRRARSLIIGYSTLPPDIMFWSIHYDPDTNSPHEFPLATTAGCDNSSGPATCTAQGFAPVGSAGGNIFKVRHDVDFALPSIKPRWNPCAHLQADPRFATVNPCSSGAGGTLAEQFAILSPIPHEIQARTGRKFASMQPGATPLITVDIQGNDATNGQYLFPFGIGLGGITVPEMVEIDLNALQTPTSFSGIPWNLDRRLSPGGCLDSGCEDTPQPLDPFPLEGTDPRTLSTIPPGLYSDPSYLSGSLNTVADRILSYVSSEAARPGGNGIGVNHTGNFTSTLLNWQAPPPSAGGPGSSEISVSNPPPLPQALICSANSAFNSPPVVQNIAVTTAATTTIVIPVLSNASDVNGDSLTVTDVTAAPSIGTAIINADGTVSFTPASGVSGTVTFTFTVSDNAVPVSGSATGTITVTVQASSNHDPETHDDGISSPEDTVVNIDVLHYVTDPDNDPLTITSVTSSANGIITNNGTDITYTPKLNFNGVDTYTYVVSDGRGGTAIGTGTVTVTPVNDAPVAVNDNAGVPAGTAMIINVLDNDTDADLGNLPVPAIPEKLTINLLNQTVLPTKGTVTTNGQTITYTATPGGATGTDSFSYSITDVAGLTSTATVNVNVIAPVLDILTTSLSQFTVRSSEWKLSGTGSVPGKTITVRLGTVNTGAIVGSATVDAAFNWKFTVKPGIQPGINLVVTAWSSGNGKLTMPIVFK
jgi:Bacterial Ig domain